MAGAGNAPGSSNGGNGSVIVDPNGGGDPGSGGPLPPTDVTVVITADNAYGFGYGTSAQLVNYYGGVENISSGDIFDCPIGKGPETYTVPADKANAGAFLYIVGYADKSTTQGVIAKFFRDGALPVFTGAGSWQGCATGIDFDPGTGGPSLDVINQQIAACNSGQMDPATTSVGWVSSAASANGRVAFGEDNSTDRDRPAPGNEFKIACDIDPTARWMWYDWEPNRTTGSPFMWPGGSGNPTKDFVIFRLAASAIPEGPPK
ncbi:MAG: hypothetical protein ABUL62_33010 [Myxococcales bacterium]